MGHLTLQGFFSRTNLFRNLVPAKSPQDTSSSLISWQRRAQRSWSWHQVLVGTPARISEKLSTTQCRSTLMPFLTISKLMPKKEEFITLQLNCSLEMVSTPPLTRCIRGTKRSAMLGCGTGWASPRHNKIPTSKRPNLPHSLYLLLTKSISNHLNKISRPNWYHQQTLEARQGFSINNHHVTPRLSAPSTSP